VKRISNAAFYKYIPAAWADPEVRNCRMAATAGAAKACLAATCSDNIAMRNNNYFPFENPHISARNNILIMTEIQVARERSITKQKHERSYVQILQRPPNKVQIEWMEHGVDSKTG
jgi:hypothetical protein